VVTGCKPVIFDVKLPLPLPLDVKLSLVVGDEVNAQHIPLEVTAPPPLSEIFPPETADDDVIDVIAVVVRVAGCTGRVVKESSFPYAVPAVFVAYALT